ncbi:hypothetical protein DL98DRAFT_659162 [Cadophora sp. DSE1049]|nr:hypothetical protein DL98DRAFT_659162 [Cadophora sp. DSE1049]
MSDICQNTSSYTNLIDPSEDIADKEDQSSLRPTVRRKPVPGQTCSSAHGYHLSTRSDETPLRLKHCYCRDILMAVILSLLTIPFFVYGGFAWYLHGKDVYEWEIISHQQVFNYGKKLATAFLYIFSLIVGRCWSQLAAWKLERSISVSSLEQMIGTPTLTSAVATQFWIRRINILSLVLLGTWSLSRIGSQSSLQLLSIRKTPDASISDCYYFDVLKEPHAAISDHYYHFFLANLFLTSLTTSLQKGSSKTDIFNNPGIPDISSFSDELHLYPLVDNEVQNDTKVLADYMDDTMVREPQTLIFRSRKLNLTAWCPITTTYIESYVTCDPSCHVTAFRSSRKPHPHSNITILGFKGVFAEFFQALAYHSEAYLSPNSSSPIELFLDDGIYHFEPEQITQEDRDHWRQYNAKIFGINLQHLINTFWYGSYNPSSFLGGDLQKASRSEIDLELDQFFIKTTAVQYWGKDEIYTCNFGWLVALFLASTVMFVAAIVGGVFSLLIYGPDILGHCSTLLRNTPYIQDSRVGSALDGYDRTRKLGNFRVKIVDIDYEKEVGYIAIAEDREGLGGRLVKGRYYR